MAPGLLRYPRCPKRALQFYLFSLIKLHLVSHPLASSHNRVTVSSKIFFRAKGVGPRKDLQYPYQEKKDGEEFVQTISVIYQVEWNMG